MARLVPLERAFLLRLAAHGSRGPAPGGNQHASWRQAVADPPPWLCRLCFARSVALALEGGRLGPRPSRN